MTRPYDVGRVAAASSSGAGGGARRPASGRHLVTLIEFSARTGLLLAGFHRGSETIHRDEFFGKQVDLDFRLFEPGQIAAALDDVGLAIEQMVERDPYPEVEVGTKRFYVLASVGAAGIF
jgi:hypothetical protein